MRALLLEPDGAARALLRDTLSTSGWRVTEAESAEGAACLLPTDDYGLVVIGCAPFDDSALALCRVARSVRADRGPLLLVVTSPGAPHWLARLASVGVDEVLIRPLEGERVASRIALAEARLNARLPAAAPGAAVETIELERQLKLQQGLLAELFQNSPEGIALLDEQDRVVDANLEFSRMFGYTGFEVRGWPIDELIVPEHARAEARRLTVAVQRGRRGYIETVRRHRDGAELDVSVLGMPVKLRDSPVAAYAIYRDIGDRKQQERALQQSEARYRTLFDQSPVGVFLCDPELRIVQCNERLTRIVGVEESAILGTRLPDFPEPGGMTDAAALQGRTLFYEGPYRAWQGAPRIWISVRYAPLHGPDGALIGGVGVVEDVTEREAAQRELRAQTAELERVNEALRERSLELEAALRARSRLYATLNHELRTPISSIMLYQELLLAGSLGPLDAEQRQALEHAHSASSHLLDLVRDVLDLSKLEAGMVALEPREVCLETLLADLVATVHPLAGRYGSEILLRVEGNRPRIVTDPQRVRQILLNLLSNAARFGGGRPIVLRARVDADRRTVIEVRDRGVGIDPADQERIFDDFVQVGSAQEGGTGLGLAISRRLAGMLRGRIEVESMPGRGSTFRLILPPFPVATPTPPIIAGDPQG